VRMIVHWHMGDVVAPDSSPHRLPLPGGARSPRAADRTCGSERR